MDRTLVYASEQPTDTIWLTEERNKMIALGYLAQGVFGTSPIVDGLGCIPTVPASLAIQILPGSIYQQSPVDSVGYGSLGIDTVDQIIKQGIILPVTSLTLTPPPTSGQAINYLVEAAVLEQDTGITVLPYFDSADPSIPFTGPGGSGTSQPTIRQCTLSLVAKSGVAATAGTQVTPAPDVGYVGLWVVTVANGATTLTSGQISQYPTAPFISVKLPQVPTWVQGGTWAWAYDSGTANQLIVNLTPTPVNIAPGFEIRLQKNALPSTGAMSIIVNGGAAIAVVNADGSALTSATPMAGGYVARLIFQGVSYRWTNAPTATAVGSITASSGEGVNVSGTSVVSLNFPALSVQPNIGLADLWAFFSQSDTHHRELSSAQLLAWLRLNLPITILTAPLVYFINPSTGFDTNNGLTTGTPFATIQKALNTIAGFNMNGYSVAINLAFGFTYAPFVSVPINGSGVVTITGNTTTPSQCLIRATSGEAALISHPGYVLQGMKFQSDANGGTFHLGIGLRVISCSTSIYNCDTGGCAYAQISAESGSLVALQGPLFGFPSGFINISGSSIYHILSTGGSTIELGGVLLNVSASVNYSGAYAIAQSGGLIDKYYSAINNASSATGIRWISQLNGVITSNAQAPSWPGSTPGFKITGGQQT